MMDTMNQVRDGAANADGGIAGTNTDLQQAVDAIWRSGGGTVTIPAGLYEMRDALHLRDGVHLVGETGAVLRKVPSVKTALRYLVGYGHYEFHVAEPQQLAVGMGVLISDDNSFGFYTTAGTIVEQRGDAFFLDRPFAHDYNPSAGAVVTAIHSLIDGHGVRGAAVRNLVLDGNLPAETNVLNGCRGAGIFLLASHDVSLIGVEVRNFHGDAISFQQCTDVMVEGCFIHHNTGGGLHPGSGSVRYNLLNNRIEENGGCGIYYCLRTTHSLCAENQIHRNGLDGISVGERDTDHILKGNLITGNQDAGIQMREPLVQSGDRVWIEANTLQGNNTGGRYAEFFIDRELHDIAFVGNIVQPEAGPAIHVGENCSDLWLADNEIDGRSQSPTDIGGHSEAVTFAAPMEFPAVGPQAAQPGDTRHLGGPPLAFL